ncbi:MAG TPA: pentapeptide repeat-containing protein, partial [Polyangiaceae bacterium]
LAKRSPGLPKDADPGFFNAAPDDQQTKGYLRGDEPFVLENLHPDKPRIEGRLPGLTTRAFVTQKTPKGDVFGEIPMRLDTVRFFPRVERGLLVYRGTIEIAEDDAADVLHLVAACEDVGAPRPAKHYRDVLTARLDRTKGLRESLRDTALMPAAGGGLTPAAPKTEMAELLAGEDLLRKNMRRRQEAEIAGLSAKLEAQGLRPADHGVVPLPPEEEPPDVDDPDAVVAFMEKHEAAAEEQRAGAEEKRAQMEARLRALCKKSGKDYDAIATQGGGPPKFSVVQQLRSVPAGALLADPTLPQKLAAIDERLKSGYRVSVHEMPAAPEPDAATRTRLGAALRQAVTRHEDVAGRDFTGADLAGQDLRGANLRGVFLEGADLSGADLTGADLSDAVLARANLGKARLTSARLAGANLGASHAQGADFTGADLSGAILARSELDGARLAEATLDRADFTETRFGTADLRGAKAAAFRVFKADLSGARLASIQLEKALFFEVDFRGADLTGALLDQASFVTCQGEGAVFQGASLRRAVFVERSSFPGADFREANLTGANFRGTVLDRCRFEAARLAGADLSEC